MTGFLAFSLHLHILLLQEGLGRIGLIDRLAACKKERVRGVDIGCVSTCLGDPSRCHNSLLEIVI